MSAYALDRPPAEPRAPRRRLHRRWWFWALIVVVILVIVAVIAAIWLGSRAQQARNELSSAQSLVGSLKTQAVAFDVPAAKSTLTNITVHTERAAQLTSDPVWRLGEAMPFVGRNLTAVRQLAAATESVMTDVATPLISVAGSVDPATLSPKNGAIDLRPFTNAIPAVKQANAGLTRAVARVDAIQTDGTIRQVVSAKRTLSKLLASLSPLVTTLNSVLPLLPTALGSEAPRTYVLMFQNNAESRSLGGTALSFAVIKMDKGRIEFGGTIPAAFGNFRSYGTPVLPLPDGTADLYAGGLGTFIANVTLRPSFSGAAQMTQEMWTRQFGYPIDGVLSIDPVALSYVLRATAPIPLSTGDTLSGDNLVPLLLNTAYLRYNSGNIGRDSINQDKLYGEVVKATFGALTGGTLHPAKLVAALTQGWNEHRVLYWSSHENEEAELVRIVKEGASGLNGELPVSDAKTARVGVYLNDNVGSKLNFYLKQSVQLGQAKCRADARANYQVKVTLTNTLPQAAVKSLSPSVLGNYKAEKLQPGVQRMIVLLYLPPGSEIQRVIVDGAPVTLEPQHDTDYPVGKVIVSVRPGASASVTYDVVAAKAGTKKLEALTTPMVNATTITTAPLDCAAVPAG
jgi:hypothetical protein